MLPRTQGIPHFHVVTSSQAANAALAFRKIMEKGYERIGYVGHRTLSSAFLGGYLQAQTVQLSERRRHLPPLLFREDHVADSESLERLLPWLDKWKPDAILTECDISPLLKKAGLHVPNRIGLAGLNILDLPFDAGVYQNFEEIGRVATLVVISLLNDNARGTPPIFREILIEGKWVDGLSLPRR